MLAVLLVGIAWTGAGLAATVAVADLERAPRLEVATLDGAAFSLADHRGEVVLVDLMAAGCPPCRETTRALTAIAAAHGANGEGGLRVVSVGVWNETRQDLRRYRDETGSDWAYALAPEVRDAWDAWAIPRVVVVDRAGLVAYESFGNASAPELSASVEEALGAAGWRSVIATGGPGLPLAGPLLLVAGPAGVALLVLLPIAQPTRDPGHRRLGPSLAAALGMAGGAVAACSLLAFPLVAARPGLLAALAGLAAMTLGLSLAAGLAVPSANVPLPRGGPRLEALVGGALHGLLAGAALAPFAVGILGAALDTLLPAAAFWALFAAVAILGVHLTLRGLPHVTSEGVERLQRVAGAIATVGGAGVLAAALWLLPT